MSLYDYCFLKFEFILAKEKFVLECTSKVSVLNSFNVIIPTVQHPPKPEYRQLYLQRLQNGISHYSVTVLGNALALANVICICVSRAAIDSNVVELPLNHWNQMIALEDAFIKQSMLQYVVQNEMF